MSRLLAHVTVLDKDSTMTTVEITPFDPDFHVELLLSDTRGIYIPQDFATEVYDPDTWDTPHPDDIDYLAEGPDNEFYWDTWTGVLDNSTYTDKNGQTWSLHQSGDLWLIQDHNYDYRFSEWLDG